jgi:hypothetical protein
MSLGIKDLTDTMFTGSGYASSSNGCDAVYFYAFSDNSLTTGLSSSSLALTASDAITPAASSITTQYLQITTTSPFTSTFYLQGKNTGKESASVSMTVQVCSPLTLASGFTVTRDILR